jgi:hypothetical protein
MVWVKSRGNADWGRIVDSVRGATKTLIPGDTGNESTEADIIQAFESDGFQVGTDNNANRSSGTFVAWCWKESATAGFDIVSYTGNGSARTISHSLSAVPKFIFLKSRDNGASGWAVYHGANTSAPETDYLILSDTAATTDNSGYWNDTAPTSSVFSLGTLNDPNKASDNFIAYLFAEKQGFSKFGTYTGNGNADGPMVFTGFRPAWIMYKPSSAVDNWEIIDIKRTNAQLGNPKDELLYANLNNAEGTDQTDRLDILSNGFKIRTSGSDYNGDGTSYIYMAFAEAPFVNSNGVPCNAR